MASRMRNYGAMLPDKLARSIRELEQRRGEAYEKCVRRGGDPDSDLLVAKQALAKKMPGYAARPWGTPDILKPAARPFCRHCGGDGISADISPRAADVARLMRQQGEVPDAALLCERCGGTGHI